MADAEEDRLTAAGRWIAMAVFVAMLVDGMDLQMLSLSLSSISKELHLTWQPSTRSDSVWRCSACRISHAP